MQTKNLILTGATGAGKTTVIDYLGARGYVVVREAFMDVYRQLRSQGCGDPLAEPHFLDSVVELQAEREAQLHGRANHCVFFDRSPLCTLALCQFMGRAPSETLLREITRLREATVYDREVFFVQNLGFAPGNEVAHLRYEDLLAFENVHREVYVAHGYRCIDIPAAPVATRAELILRYSHANL